MNILKTKNKKRVLAGLGFLLIIFSVILSTVTLFFSNNTQKVYAEGFSPEDTLYLATLENSVRHCINKGVLRTNSGKVQSDSASRSTLFDTSNKAYKNENEVKLLYKYGAGNSIDDGGISCEQLFYGFRNNNNNNSTNSFNTFPALGGKFAPDSGNKNNFSNVNTFLEALGYTVSGTASNAYCATIVYKANVNGVLQRESTAPLCISANKDGIITAADGSGVGTPKVYIQNNNDNAMVQLRYDSPLNSGFVTLSIKTPQKDDGICPAGTFDVVISNQSPNNLVGQSAETFFNNFFDKVSSANIDNITPSNGVCTSKTLKEAYGAGSVVFDAAESRSETQKLNNSSNTSLADFRIYERTGSASSQKLMQYFVPSYTNINTFLGNPAQNSGGFVFNQHLNQNIASGNHLQHYKAYNWYHILKNSFNVISMDSNGCSNVKPDSSAAYLQYYRDATDNSGRKEIQYCLLDGATLDSKNNTKIMTNNNSPGVVNGISYSSLEVEPLTARQALGNLNRYLDESDNFAQLCKTDPSFPLCKATPIECKDDPNKEGCKDITNASATEEDTENGEQAACMQNAGALGWMICPMLYGLRDMAQGIFEHAVEPLLRVHDSVVQEIGKSSGDSPMYMAWSFFRNVANILFVIALLFVIFSQVTGFGIDNYGIKKILPKLIITAIIVNFSYLICGALIDISHLVGDGVKNIFENIAPDIATSTPAAKDGPTFAGSILQIVTVLGGAAGATVGGIALASAFTSGSLLAVILPILSFVGAAAVAAFFAMLMLGLRQALIIIMIALSPVAFVLYAIPNTNGLFKKWLQLFRILLMLYPVYCFMVGGGFMAANLIVMASKEFYMQLIAGLVSLAPYFMVPSMTKNALKGFDSAVGGIAKLQALTGRAGTSLNKKITSSEPYKASVENKEYGKLSRFADKYKNYSSAELANLNRNERRRLTRAIGVIGKDAEQTARLGAAMSQFRANTDPAGMDAVGISAMRTEDENQKKQFMVKYANSNLSYTETLERLNAMQDYDYSDHSVQDNHNHDIEMSALQSHLLSTKDGQKAYNEYLQGKEIEVSKDNKFKAGRSSDRARAVLARDFVANHSNLKDKYQIAFAQMQSMQGNGTIEELDGTSAISGALSATRSTGLNNFANRIDFKDFETLGKADAKELTRARDAQGRVVQAGERIIDSEARKNLEKATKEFAATIQNDPTRAGSYYSEIKELVADRTGNLSGRGTDIDSLGDRTLVVRGSDGGVVYSANFETGRSNSSGNNSSNSGARGTSGGNNGSNGNNGSSNSGNNGTSSGNSTSSNSGGSGSNGGQQQKPPQQNP